MWKPIERPGQFGDRREEIFRQYDQEYGSGNWRVVHMFGHDVISEKVVHQLYENSYVDFFKKNPERLEWLLANASNVWDSAESNVESGLDYSIQETPSLHLQDIAIRRAIQKLGREFQGDRLIRVYSKDPEGGFLSPGRVPFSLPKMIEEPHLKGWWDYNSIEDFYQSNKYLQVREVTK
tara:strand:- start:1391 stop:1927 length:537 start_codon:yes stop_codon:yes gene_type:complete